MRLQRSKTLQSTNVFVCHGQKEKVMVWPVQVSNAQNRQFDQRRIPIQKRMEAIFWKIQQEGLQWRHTKHQYRRQTMGNY